MTDTTTADHTAAGPDLSGANSTEGKSLATIAPEQQRFTDAQIAILRQLGIEDATQGDLDLFFHYCRTTGLDPFRKQIYMIGRNTKVTDWVDEPGGGRRRVERFVTKYTIQTGIDGYRRNGREAAKRLGDELRFDGPYWCGEDGQWRDVWVAKNPPFAAKFTIYRNGEPYTGVAHFDEYVQTNNVYEGSGQNRRVVGEEPNSMWRKMPRNQIAKCAEALAWRRAYPDDFSGLILEDVAQPTIIDQDGNPDPQPGARAGGRGLAGMRRARQQRAQQQRDIVDAEEAALPAPAAEPAAEGDLRQTMRRKLTDEIFAKFTELELAGDDRGEDRLDLIRALLDLPELEATKDLTDDQLQELRNELATVKRSKKSVDDDLRDWINSAELRRVAAEGDEQ